MDDISKKIAKAAIMTTVALGLGANSNANADNSTNSASMEKCYGIVKKGKNDCGTDKHSCKGNAKKNRHPAEWIYLPKGTCDKIVGGSLSLEESKSKAKNRKDKKNRVRKENKKQANNKKNTENKE